MGYFLKRDNHYYMAIYSRLALIFFRCHRWSRRAVFWWMIIWYFASMMNSHGELIATSKSGEMISFIINFVQVVDQSYLHYAQWSCHGSLGVQGIQILWSVWCLAWIRIHNTSLYFWFQLHAELNTKTLKWELLLPNSYLLFWESASFKGLVFNYWESFVLVERTELARASWFLILASRGRYM